MAEKYRQQDEWNGEKKKFFLHGMIVYCQINDVYVCPARFSFR
jgi:hypothetical protein